MYSIKEFKDSQQKNIIKVATQLLQLESWYSHKVSEFEQTHHCSNLNMEQVTYFLLTSWAANGSKLSLKGLVRAFLSSLIGAEMGTFPIAKSLFPPILVNIFPKSTMH